MARMSPYQLDESSAHTSAFLACTLLMFLISIGGVWIFASWAVAVHQNEDYHMVVLLGGALPFIAVCVTLHWLLLYQYRHRGSSRQQIVRTAIISLILTWPMFVVTTLLTTSIPLPMLNERTPTTSTLWVLLMLCWTLVISAILLISIVTRRIALHQSY